MSAQRFDRSRRAFLGSTSAVAGGMVIAALVPFSAVPDDNLTAPFPMAPFAKGTHDSVWDIDSACGHFPSYAHPIPYTPVADAEQFAGSNPLDHLFVV